MEETLIKMLESNDRNSVLLGMGIAKEQLTPKKYLKLKYKLMKNKNNQNWEWIRPFANDILFHKLYNIKLL